MRLSSILVFLGFGIFVQAAIDYFKIYKQLHPFGFERAALDSSPGKEKLQEWAEMYDFVTFKGLLVKDLSDADKTEFHEALCALFSTNPPELIQIVGNDKFTAVQKALDAINRKKATNGQKQAYQKATFDNLFFDSEISALIIAVFDGLLLWNRKDVLEMQNNEMIVETLQRISEIDLFGVNLLLGQEKFTAEEKSEAFLENPLKSVHIFGLVYERIGLKDHVLLCEYVYEFMKMLENLGESSFAQEEIFKYDSFDVMINSDDSQLWVDFCIDASIRRFWNVFESYKTVDSLVNLKEKDKPKPNSLTLYAFRMELMKREQFFGLEISFEERWNCFNFKPATWKFFGEFQKMMEAIKSFDVANLLDFLPHILQLIEEGFGEEGENWELKHLMNGEFGKKMLEMHQNQFYFTLEEFRARKCTTFTQLLWNWNPFGLKDELQFQLNPHFDFVFQPENFSLEQTEKAFEVLDWKKVRYFKMFIQKNLKTSIEAFKELLNLIERDSIHWLAIPDCCQIVWEKNVVNDLEKIYSNSLKYLAENHTELQKASYVKAFSNGFYCALWIVKPFRENSVNFIGRSVSLEEFAQTNFQILVPWMIVSEQQQQLTLEESKEIIEYCLKKNVFAIDIAENVSFQWICSHVGEFLQKYSELDFESPKAFLDEKAPEFHLIFMQANLFGMKGENLDESSILWNLSFFQEIKGELKKVPFFTKNLKELLEFLSGISKLDNAFFQSIWKQDDLPLQTNEPEEYTVKMLKNMKTFLKKIRVFGEQEKIASWESFQEAVDFIVNPPFLIGWRKTLASLPLFAVKAENESEAEAQIKRINEEELNGNLKEFEITFEQFFRFISKATQPSTTLMRRTRQVFPVASFREAMDIFLRNCVLYLQEIELVSSGTKGAEFLEACSGLCKSDSNVEMLSQGDFFKMCTIFGKEAAEMEFEIALPQILQAFKSANLELCLEIVQQSKELPEKPDNSTEYMKEILEEGLSTLFNAISMEKAIDEALKSKDLLSNWDPYGRIEELAFMRNPSFDFSFDLEKFVGETDFSTVNLKEFKEFLLKNQIQDPKSVLALINNGSEHYEVKDDGDVETTILQIVESSLKDLIDNYEQILAFKNPNREFQSFVSYALWLGSCFKNEENILNKSLTLESLACHLNLGKFEYFPTCGGGPAAAEKTKNIFVKFFKHSDLHDFLVAFDSLEFKEIQAETFTLKWLHEKLPKFSEAIQALGFQSLDDFLEGKEHPLASLEFFDKKEQSLSILALCQLKINSSQNAASKSISQLLELSKMEIFQQAGITEQHSFQEAIDKFIQKINGMQADEFESLFQQPPKSEINWSEKLAEFPLFGIEPDKDVKIESISFEETEEEMRLAAKGTNPKCRFFFAQKLSLPELQNWESAVKHFLLIFPKMPKDIKEEEDCKSVENALMLYEGNWCGIKNASFEKADCILALDDNLSGIETPLEEKEISKTIYIKSHGENAQKYVMNALEVLKEVSSLNFNPFGLKKLQKFLKTNPEAASFIDKSSKHWQTAKSLKEIGVSPSNDDDDDAIVHSLGLIYDYALQELQQNMEIYRKDSFVKVFDSVLDVALWLSKAIPKDSLNVEADKLQYDLIDLPQFHSHVATEESLKALQHFLKNQKLSDFDLSCDSIASFCKNSLPEIMNLIGEYDSLADFVANKEPAHFNALFPCNFFSGSMKRKENILCETWEAIKEFKNTFPKDLVQKSQFITILRQLETASCDSSFLIFHQLSPPSKKDSFPIQVQCLLNQLKSLVSEGKLGNYLTLLLPKWLVELSKVKLFDFSTPLNSKHLLALAYNQLNEPLVNFMKSKSLKESQLAQLISLVTRNVFHCAEGFRKVNLSSVIKKPKSYQEAVNCLKASIKEILNLISSEASSPFEELVLFWDSSPVANKLWNNNFLGLKNRFPNQKVHVIKKLDNRLNSIVNAVEKYEIDLENLENSSESVFQPGKSLDALLDDFDADFYFANLKNQHEILPILSQMTKKKRSWIMPFLLSLGCILGLLGLGVVAFLMKEKIAIFFRLKSHPKPPLI